MDLNHHKVDEGRDWFLMIKYKSIPAIEFNVIRHYLIKNKLLSYTDKVLDHHMEHL